MKKIFFVVLTLLCWLALITPSFATSTQVDALIEKLVQKGILTKTEAIELKGEIAADEKLMREEGLKQTLPEWVQRLKLKGDLRVRYQWEQKQHAAEERMRGRIRYRLGLETQVNDTTKVAAGLASGAEDPRSTNQTFENSFQHPDIRLDYAFIEYEPIKGKKLAAGKFLFKDYLWTPTDMLWDTDINPEGGAVHLEHGLVKDVTGYVNVGSLVIDENGATDRSDPFLIYNQGGLKWKDENAGLSANAAGVYYAFNGTKGADLDSERNTNTQTGGGADSTLRYDYDSVGGSAEFGIERPFGLEKVEELGFFGDYIYNLDSGDDDTKNEVDDGWGWSAGIRFGNKKVVNAKQWQLKYLFTMLQKDAFPDTFPDSDRHGGDTDIKAHEAIFEYGFNKNVSLALDYYQVRRLRAAEATEHLVQSDVNFKF